VVAVTPLISSLISILLKSRVASGLPVDEP
jgi:hypothetical protein